MQWYYRNLEKIWVTFVLWDTAHVRADHCKDIVVCTSFSNGTTKYPITAGGPLLSRVEIMEHHLFKYHWLYHTAGVYWLITLNAKPPACTQILVQLLSQVNNLDYYKIELYRWFMLFLELPCRDSLAPYGLAGTCRHCVGYPWDSTIQFQQ